VVYRVEELADRPEGFTPADAIPFKHLVPLDEIIAEAKGMGKASKAIEREYLELIGNFGPELEILLKADDSQLAKMPFKIAEGIRRVREGRLKILPGYDGEYGTIDIFLKEDKAEKRQGQMTLF
jgi:PHP family Zn ribbon phosphoesterase